MIGSTIQQYKILEKLGAGGQGTVYKALDTKLDRMAVIKVLPPELTAKTANFKRFEREAQLCSQLDHPNICTIYDFNEVDGTFYIAMQYVEGKNVRQLVNGRPLELKSALSIAIQVCDALAYTHARNIIHRDIKAGNIMVTQSGQVKILDFGLAKLLQGEHEKDSAAHQADLTEIGIPYGTATYAAPEQAKGEFADHRADIFSTGVLLYELLTGIWAFQGKTVVDVRHQVLHGTPTPLAEMRPEPVSPRLQQILDRALAKAPADRYQKISEMREDLRAVLMEISGVPMIQAEAYKPRHLVDDNPIKKAWNWIKGKNSTDSPVSLSPSAIPAYASNDAQSITMTSTGAEKKSVAILPFKNLSQDAKTAFYEFSLADAVITELAKLRSLIVRPSSVIARYHGSDTDPRQAGRELRVNAVLSAGYIATNQKMRVTAQLVDVDSGDILWSDRIDAEGADILALQDKIASRILEGLRLELSEKEQEQLGRRPTENAEAYEEFLRGRDNFGRFIFRTVAAEDCDAAIQNFRHAIELDPTFALAYSGLGACYANRRFKGMGTPEDYTHAESAFSKAYKYDPNVTEARVLMVMIYMSRGEKKKARAEIKVLEQQFPNDAPLYFVKGTMHRLDGEYEKSLKAWEKLSRLDPMARVVASYNRARIHLYQGDYDEAMRQLDKGAALEPNHLLIKVFRAFVFYYQGRLQEAEEIIREVLQKNAQMEGVHPILSLILATQGRREEAQAELTDETRLLSKSDHDMAYWMAQANSMLGNLDESAKWLERAIKLGNENVPWFLRDPAMENFRRDSRFQEIIGKIEPHDPL